MPSRTKLMGRAIKAVLENWRLTIVVEFDLIYGPVGSFNDGGV